MNIKLVHHEFGGSTIRCGICGRIFDHGHAQVWLGDDGEPMNGAGYVCPICLAAGPKRAAGIAADRANDMRAYADELDFTADVLNRMDERYWKTVAAATRELFS